MCDIDFEKVQVHAGKANRTSVYADAVVRMVLLKRFYENFSRIHKKHMCRNLFFDKVKLCRSATSLKSRL